MSGSIDVSVPGPGDADRMAAVHVQAWAETYSALLPARFYDEDVLARRRRMWRDILAVRQPRLRVARVGEVVVGFAFASDDVTAPAVRPLELHMLYVLSAFSGNFLTLLPAPWSQLWPSLLFPSLAAIWITVLIVRRRRALAFA